MSTDFKPRPAQQAILAYEGGPMGVSAVPGSGKTFTLSLLAAQLVEKLAAQGKLDEQEVLIVTFTNSAVENFRSRIGQFLREERGLLSGVGYRVRTLHGLAHDIVRERPGLVGLSENFDIIDERTANDIKRDAVIAYMQTNPDVFGPFILPEYLQNPRRIERYLLADAVDLANNLIRVAKELRVEAGALAARLEQQSGTWPLLNFGIRVYADYQRSLFTRGAVDFDDLIVLALQALQTDDHFLHRLQARWPYVLEDEAQDSSLLQETMLRLLTNDTGNWVRVGDPNQAINTTFTSADIRYLRDFVRRYPDQSRNLPNSGRSALPIIDAANFLIEWSRRAHPVLDEKEALAPPLIEPTAPDDPQPNPPPGNPAVHIYDRALTPDEELNVILTSLARWLPEHAGETVAVLAPENNRGFKVADALKDHGIAYDDSLLRSDSATRAAALALAIILGYIAEPQSPGKLAALWEEVWWPKLGVRRLRQLHGLTDAQEIPGFDPTVTPEPVAVFGRALSKLRQPEDFIFPGAADWLDAIGWLDEVPYFSALVETFRDNLKDWTKAAILPVDELLLTLGNDIFDKPANLALTHRLAVLLAKLSEENPAWRLPELAGELDDIAQNKRRLLGFTEDALGYEAKPGQVTVATMHAAKGLEWDRVYLLAVNDYSYPAGLDSESYRGERWYVRNRLNLVAEAEAQLRLLHDGSLDGYAAGEATVQARRAIGAERLRLLYVGVTRARRELILTYNTGRNPEKSPNNPAVAFEALHGFVHGASE
ncbi:MAG: ATP-dependent helicase [Caldilineaceae bacterium]|nr:ATP-dependent helicase [Caldilineaceae bacterium]